MTGAQGNRSYQPGSRNGNTETFYKNPDGHSLAVETPFRMDISDLSQQVWILQGESLVSVPRTADMKPVTVLFMPCNYQESLDHNKGNAIYMGIGNPTMCLFCENTEGKPMLKLKAQRLEELYHNPEPVKPFLFYHSQDGRTSTFESVAFPDYFIASSEKDQPVFLTNKTGENNISFYFTKA